MMRLDDESIDDAMSDDPSLEAPRRVSSSISSSVSSSEPLITSSNDSSQGHYVFWSSARSSAICAATADPDSLGRCIARCASPLSYARKHLCVEGTVERFKEPVVLGQVGNGAPAAAAGGGGKDDGITLDEVKKHNKKEYE